MRTTLDIAPDILSAAKELAQRQRTTAGAVISDLARRALTQSPSTPTVAGRTRKLAVAPDALGFHPLPSRGGIVTNELIDQLRDELGV